MAFTAVTLDRSAAERVEPGLLDRLRREGTTRILTLRGGKLPVCGDALVWEDLSPSGVGEMGPDSASISPASSGAEVWIFLGRDAERAYVARMTPDPPPATGEGDAAPGSGVTEWKGLREVFGILNPADGTIAATATALSNWHTQHRFCATCGAPSAPQHAGWIRVCERCGTEHYPRTDSAIIVSVVDDADRLLLGRGAAWPPGRFSTLAGFLEPGETFEAATAREVFEEVGVEVDEVRYLGSQPWPFPTSIMVAMTARARNTELTLDESEIIEARWVSRSDYLAALASGEILRPSGPSVSRALIEHWLGVDPASPEI